MRGPPALSLRASPALRSQPEIAQGQPATIPAPVGGWNTINNLASMPPIDAVVLDNFYPSTDAVVLRGGSVSWATGVTGAINTLVTYTAGAVRKFYACSSSGIYDITAGGAVGAVAKAATDGKWQYVNLANAAGTFLIMVNGVDSLVNFDGTTWTSVTAISANPITGVTTTSLANIALHKRRVWFVENASMNAWYLPTDAITGAAVKFPMGALFKKGGYLMAQIGWTIDSGTGPDDYFATVTSEGECAVYKGNDVSSATDWFLVGVYDVGIPIGRRCLARYGGDVLMITEQGLFPLSKLLNSIAVDRTASINQKINQAYVDAATTYKSVFGWNATVYPSESALILNIPTAANTTSQQFVMNMITKAWCRFTGWNSNVIAMNGSSLYYALAGNVYLAWAGVSDNGVSIVGAVQQAYTNFKSPAEKSVPLVRPTITMSSSATIAMALDSDFAVYSGETQISYNSGSSVVWDTAVWDTSLWDSGAIPYSSNWYTVPSKPGFFHSFRMQITTSRAIMSWISTDFVVQRGGIL